MMTRLTKIAVFLIFAIVSSLPVYAGDAGRESQFSIGPTARASGLGSGLVGLADGSGNIFYNQAAMATLDYQEVSLMHSTLFESSVYDVVSYIYPTARAGSFGLSFMRLGTGDIIKRTDWLYEDKFDYSIQQLIVAYGRRVEGGFYLGGALKIVNQSMDHNSTYGVGADLSFYKPIGRRLSFGILFQDIIPARLKLDEELEAIPYNAMIGMGLKDIEIAQDIMARLNFALDIPEERSAKIHTGVETSYKDWLDVRFGFDRDNFAFGFGVKYNNLKFNYAYRLMEGITDSHRFGFSFYIGPSISAKIRREIELESARGSYLILDDRRKQFENYREVADDYYKANDLDSAFAYYQRALAYKGGDQEVVDKIQTINKIKMAEIAKLQERSSDEELKSVLLSGYYTQADKFYSEELYTSSLGVIETALAIKPDDFRFSSLRDKNNRAIENMIANLLDSARSAENEGRFTDALANYNKILDYSPGDETVQRLVSRIGNAIQIARLVSEGAEAYYNNNFDKATSIFRDVQKIESDNIIAEDFLMKIQSAQKAETEQGQLENDPMIWQKYLNALELYQGGEYQKAIDLWEEVLESYPGNEKTIENIKQARLRLQSE